MRDPERRARWNERWNRRDYAELQPAAVVPDYAYLLPSGGMEGDRRARVRWIPIR